MEYDIGKQLQTPLQMLAQCRCINTGFLFRGEGVQLAPHSVYAVAYVVRFPVFGPFEYGMFYKMGYALFGPLFIPRTYVYVYTRMGHYRIVLSENDADTVIESMILIHVDGVVLF